MTREPRAHLGVIGGSGLYEMSSLRDVETVSVDTPYGLPSDDLVLGTLEGTRVAFLPRHGRGHRYTPSEVPYRANLWALKSIGCEFVLSVSATGSLREELAPGHLVVVDQFIDRTVGRARSFFGDGLVGHVGFGDPVCGALRGIVLDAARATPAPAVHDGGTYVCIEGPTFSTRAESLLYRSWGVSVIGMTNLPEARLAREAGLSYATLALVTDYDCWHQAEAEVSVESVLAVLHQNVRVAQEVVVKTAAALAAEGVPRVSPYHSAAAHALMTRPDAVPVDRRRVASLLFGEYLG
ncbi:MAG: S-methyl-5'-thioadenosine phosphorylase [Myxococcota bacterium]